MIFPQFVIYVLIDNYLKFRKDPSITSQEIVNYISVALAVALSVHKLGIDEWLVHLVQSMYKYVRSRVRVGDGILCLSRCSSALCP